jgi:hypothetical protein
MEYHLFEFQRFKIVKTLTFLVNLGLGWGIFFIFLGLLALFIWYVGFQVFSQLEGDSDPPVLLHLLGAAGAGLGIIGFLNVF